ncbi:MAG: hypothetical protein FP831_09075 [Anaerolineae bacterium]|nr:hypothetical protein [Anaerolineae bacterium]
MDDKAKQLLNLIEDKIQALAEETDSVRFSDTFISYLAVIGRFHHYSFRNQLLISFGYPNATHVAGYKDWARKFNRQVKKGEHGIAILAPVIGKKPERKNTSDADENEKEGVIITTDEDGYLRFGKDFITYRTVYVFDVSQTEGDPLPESPNWHDFEKNPEVEAALKSFATSKGIKIEIVESLHGADGASSGGKIRILPKAGTRTMIHELAHEILHWGHPELKLSTKQEEIEADATAFVVAQYFNISQDPQTSPNYLALHNADSKAILACFNRIRETSVQIIEAIELGMDRSTKKMEGAA